jgi:hypothetical protein
LENLYYTWWLKLKKLFSSQASNTTIISALNYGLPVTEGFWLRADPVELRADLAGIYLLGTDHLALLPDEIAVLNDQINQLLRQDGLVLHTPSSHAWFLQSLEPIAIKTHSPIKLIGKEISHYQPTGPDYKKWQALQTEIQMILHHSEVNQLRTAQGKPVVNSLWFWK